MQDVLSAVLVTPKSEPSRSFGWGTVVFEDGFGEEISRVAFMCCPTALLRSAPSLDLTIIEQCPNV